MKNSSWNGWGPVGWEAIEKLSNEICASCGRLRAEQQANWSGMMDVGRDIWNPFKKYSIVYNASSITTAPSRSEKGQLPVLVSATLHAPRKSQGFCKHSSFPVQCSSLTRNLTVQVWKGLKWNPKSTEDNRSFAAVSPGWQPLTSGQASPWDGQPVHLEGCRGYCCITRRKIISNYRAFFPLFKWIINVFYLLQITFSHPAVVCLDDNTYLWPPHLHPSH